MSLFLYFEEYTLHEFLGEKSTWHFVGAGIEILLTISFMQDVGPILTNDRTRKAKTCWCWPTSTSLFGWTYMKLKFLIMRQVFVAIYLVADMESFKDLKKLGEVEDQVEEETGNTLMHTSIEVFMYISIANCIIAMATYMSIYHCLKRIDDDDRHNNFPDHDYNPDGICCCVGDVCVPKNITVVRTIFWIIYSIVFLSFLIVFINKDDCESYDDDDRAAVNPCFLDNEYFVDKTRGIIFACFLFVGMVAHQLYYRIPDNKVAPVSDTNSNTAVITGTSAQIVETAVITETSAQKYVVEETKKVDIHCDGELDKFLTSLDLEKHRSSLQKFDFKTVQTMSKQDLIDAGLPLGAAMKIVLWGEDQMMNDPDFVM